MTSMSSYEPLTCGKTCGELIYLLNSRAAVYISSAVYKMPGLQRLWLHNSLYGENFALEGNVLSDVLL